MMRRVFLLMLFFLLSAHYSFADMEHEIRRSADKIASVKGARIAVTGVLTRQGTVNGLTDYVSDKIGMALSDYSDIKILDRSRIYSSVADENARQFSPLHDENVTAVKLGLFINASDVIGGTVEKLEDAYEISLYLVNCETGAIASGTQSSFKISGSEDMDRRWNQKGKIVFTVTPSEVTAEITVNDKYLGATDHGKLETSVLKPNDNVSVTIRATGYREETKTVFIPPFAEHSMSFNLKRTFYISAWQEELGTSRKIGMGGVVKSGKKYRLCLQSSSGGYVYIFNRTPNGEFNTLVPSKHMQNNWVDARQSVCFPNGDGFILDNETGKENILILVSETERSDMKELAKSLESEEPQKYAKALIDLERYRSDNAWQAKGYHPPDEPVVVSAMGNGSDVRCRLWFDHK